MTSQPTQFASVDHARLMSACPQTLHEALREPLSVPAAAQTPLASRKRAFRQLTQAHPLWSHPLIARCQSGALSLAEVRVLGGQMYQFCREFPRLLAIAMTLCEDEAARVVIGENLWEELGEGRPELTHAAMFRRFTRALGLSDAELESLPALPETQALIDTYSALGERWGLLGLLGALCYASEGIVAALYTHLRSGLLSARSFTPDDLMFFEVHIHVDDGHADQLESVLQPWLTEPTAVMAVEAAIEEAMTARCRFFDGVMRAAAPLPLPQEASRQALGALNCVATPC